MILSFKTQRDTPGFQIFFTDLGLVWFQEGLLWGLVSGRFSMHIEGPY